MIAGKKKEGIAYEDQAEKAIQGANIKIFIEEKTQPINIHKILQVEEDDDQETIKWVFRSIISEKMTIFQRKQIALASLIIFDQNTYNKGQKPVYNQEISYTYKETIFHYVATSDFIKLMKTLCEHPDMINETDKMGNNLIYIAAKFGYYAMTRYLLHKGINVNQKNNIGSTPLHAASFYGHSSIVELLLLNGADYEIINSFNNKAIDEAQNEQIENFIMNHKLLSKDDPVQQTILNLRKQDCLHLCIKVYSPDKEYIGIFGSIKYNPTEQKKLKEYLKNRNDYTRGYHGTKVESADKIIKYGFIRPSKRGTKVRPGHIDHTRTINGIPNWGDALFMSQSIYMACNTCYAETVKIQAPIEGVIVDENDQKLADQKKENYQFLFQVAIRHNPKRYSEHFHTLGKGNYIKQSDEPDMLEWRVQEEDDIVLLGFYFIREEVLKKIKSHEKMRDFCDEEGRMAGIMTSDANTIRQPVDFKNLCLIGHVLTKLVNQEIECDVCGKYNKGVSVNKCDKCQFVRCGNCQQKQLLI